MYIYTYTQPYVYIYIYIHNKLIISDVSETRLCLYQIYSCSNFLMLAETYFGILQFSTIVIIRYIVIYYSNMVYFILILQYDNLQFSLYRKHDFVNIPATTDPEPY